MLIVKVPFINGLGKTKGCEKAPNILAKNAMISNKIKTEEIKVNNDNVREGIKEIYDRAFEIFRKYFKKQLKKKSKREQILFIGGDHSMSYPVAKAFSKYSRQKKCLIVLDAHADCMKPMKEPTHEEWLRAVLEEKLFDKIVLVGLRKVEPEEKKFLEKHKEVQICNVLDLLENYQDYDIYLSIDIDVFDPSIAPGTGYLEPNGLSKEEFFRLIDKIKNKTRAIDLVEVNPEKDLNNKTINLTLDIIKKTKEG